LSALMRSGASVDSSGVVSSPDENCGGMGGGSICSGVVVHALNSVLTAKSRANKLEYLFIAAFFLSGYSRLLIFSSAFFRLSFFRRKPLYKSIIP